MTTYREITGLLRAAMGFDAAALSASAVTRAVRKRMLHCHQSDEAAYLIYLRVSPLEMTQLIEELVVPETWFFRDGKPFEWLKQYVREQWLPANPQRPLRLLSVPSSSGEEPYSAVMALLDAGLPPERIQVEAVDISHVALAKAKRGLYGRNSFRNVPPGVQERYFTFAQQGWALHNEVRNLVVFSQANLLADDFAAGHFGYDVIFCRNLLIYFDEENRERALAVLDKILMPQGILFVGHAESAPVLDRWFASTGVPQTFAYRKKGMPSIATRHPPREARREPSRPVTKRVPPMRPLPRQVSAIAPAAPVVLPEDYLEQARRLADQGRLAEAAVLCENHLREHGPAADAYYLLGLVHDAGRDPENAQNFFGKAVYLQPNHYEALVHLALLAEKSGAAQDAVRWRQRAERVARRRGAEQ